MIVRLLTDGALYGIAALLQRGLQIALLPLYVTALTPVDLARIELVWAIVVLAQVLLTLQLTDAVGRHLNDAPDPARVTGSANAGVLAFTGLAALGALGSGVLAGIALAAVLLQVASNFLIGHLRWLLAPGRVLLATGGGAAIQTLVALVLLLGPDPDAGDVFVSWIAGHATAAGLALASRREVRSLRIDLPMLGRLLRFSLPIVVAAIGLVSLNVVDRFALAGLAPPTQLGHYAFAARLALVALLLTVPLDRAVMPRVMAHWREPAMPIHLERLQRGYAALSLLLLAGVVGGLELLFRLPALASWLPARHLTFWLTSSVLLVQSHVLFPGLLLQGRTRRLAALGLGVIALDVLLNLALVPTLGAIGAAMGTLGTAIAFIATMASISLRLYPLPGGANRFRWVAALGGWLALAVLPTVLSGSLWLLPAAALSGLAGALVLVRGDEWRILATRIRGN